MTSSGHIWWGWFEGLRNLSALAFDMQRRQTAELWSEGPVTIITSASDQIILSEWEVTLQRWFGMLHNLSAGLQYASKANLSKCFENPTRAQLWWSFNRSKASALWWRTNWRKTMIQYFPSPWLLSEWIRHSMESINKTSRPRVNHSDLIERTKHCET